MTIPNNLNPLKIPDFNGDGKTDAFWRSEQTNQNAIWLIDGTRLQGSGFLPSVPEEDGWTEIGQGDFNGDNKTDLFWHNTKTGQNAVWLIDDTNLAQAAFLPTTSLSYDWNIGDFNGDAKADLFWRNTATGENAIWLMNGVNLADAKFVPSLADAWDYRIGDFDGNNKTDFFWRNTATGENAVWLMDGVNLAQSAFTRNYDTSWDEFEVVYYDGNNQTDIFWRDSQTGKNSIWTWVESGLRPGVTDLNLPSKGADFAYELADLNGDNRVDFLWRNQTSGENEIWLAGGASVLVNKLLSPPSEWFPGVGDFNGDGLSDLAWYNTATGENAIWLIGTNQNRSQVQIAQADYLPSVPPSQRWEPFI